MAKFGQDLVGVLAESRRAPPDPTWRLRLADRRVDEGQRRALNLNVIHAMENQTTLNSAVAACRDCLTRCAPQAFATAKIIQRTLGE
jgi:hypothetical protein